MAILKVANIHHDASGFTRTQISTANTITFYTSNQERVSINASGYMQVAGQINAASLLINGVAASNISNSYAVSVGAASNTYAGSVGAASNAYAASVGVAANSYAMTWANSKFLANTSGVFNGNLTISGNVTTTGSIELGNATDTTISRISAGNVAIEGNVIYRAGGTDVGLADGGTGASLTDPNADRIMFWDDSAGSVAWLTPGTGLTISGTTITASGSVDRQVFDASDTWNKPSSGTVALIECWGGGGSGERWTSASSADGGSGGAYTWRWILLSGLTATVTVTVGAGGASRTGSNQAGANGGDTSFGSYLTAYGGSGGGVVGGTAGGWASGGVGSNDGYFGGAGGGNGDTPTAGGSSFLGGAGGGAIRFSGTTSAAGISKFGGNGGAASSGTATAGSQPGGGGGGGQSTSGAGGAGRVIVTVW